MLIVSRAGCEAPGRSEPLTPPRLDTLGRRAGVGFKTPAPEPPATGAGFGAAPQGFLREWHVAAATSRPAPPKARTTSGAHFANLARRPRERKP